MTDPDRDRIDRMVLMIPDDEHGSEGQHNATQAALGLATIARALLAYKHSAASRIASLEQQNETLRAELAASVMESQDGSDTARSDGVPA